MPVVWPAVYRPVAVIVPPVAVNVALTGATELSLYLPDTENCFVVPTYTVAVSGERMMRTRVGGATVTLEVPLFPSVAAVIVAEPAATPVTSPLALTVAADGVELDHVTTRPDKAFPFESLGVAVSCTVWPTCSVADAGVTLTDATGTLVTVTDAVLLCPSLVAVIVAEPRPTPVTRPTALTAATDELLLTHVTVRPLSTLPAESFVVAESCAVWLTSTVVDVGFSVTDATGAGVTVTTAVSELPPGLPVATTLTFPVSEPVL